MPRAWYERSRLRFPIFWVIVDFELCGLRIIAATEHHHADAGLILFESERPCPEVVARSRWRVRKIWPIFCCLAL